MPTDLTPAERQKAEKWFINNSAIQSGQVFSPAQCGGVVTLLTLYARSCERAAVEKCLQLVKSSAAPSGVDAAILREFESLLSEEKP